MITTIEEEIRAACTHWLICKKDYGVFKKGEHYWLEILLNGNMFGRSDNVKGMIITVPFLDFYEIFTLSSERV
jgi:hypothetical protein